MTSDLLSVVLMVVHLRERDKNIALHNNRHKFYGCTLKQGFISVLSESNDQDISRSQTYIQVGSFTYEIGPFY